MSGQVGSGSPGAYEAAQVKGQAVADRDREQVMLRVFHKQGPARLEDGRSTESCFILSQPRLKLWPDLNSNTTSQLLRSARHQTL